MGLGSEREREVCEDAKQVEGTGKKLSRVLVWALCFAFLVCLLFQAGAHWPLNAPEKHERKDFCIQYICSVYMMRDFASG